MSGKKHTASILAQNAMRVVNTPGGSDLVEGAELLTRIRTFCNAIHQKVDELRDVDREDLPEPQNPELVREANKMVPDFEQWQKYLLDIFLKMAYMARKIHRERSNYVFDLRGENAKGTESNLFKEMIELMEMYDGAREIYEQWQGVWEERHAVRERVNQLEEDYLAEKAKSGTQELTARAEMLRTQWGRIMSKLEEGGDVREDVLAYYMQTMSLLFNGVNGQQQLMMLNLAWHEPSVLGEKYADRLMKILAYFVNCLMGAHVALRALKLVEVGRED